MKRLTYILVFLLCVMTASAQTTNSFDWLKIKKGLVGSVNANGFSITNLLSGTNPGDAVTYSQMTNAVAGVSTNGLASVPYVDGATNQVLITSTNLSIGDIVARNYVTATVTNGLSSVSYVNGATNQVLITATNLAIGDIVARNYVTATVTNGLAPVSYVNGATNQVLITSTNLAIGDIVARNYVTATVTNGLASTNWVLGLGYVTQTITNGLQPAGAYVTASVTNGLASVTFVNGATNQAVVTATNLAIGDIVARNYVTASITNGLAASASLGSLAYQNSNSVNAINGNFTGTLTVQTLVVQTVTNTTMSVTNFTLLGSLDGAGVGIVTNMSRIYGPFYMGSQYLSTNAAGFNMSNPLTINSTISDPDNIIISKVSADTQGASLQGKKARGTPGSPSAVLAEDRILSVGGSGYNGASYPDPSPAAIRFVAGENWNAGSNGAYISFNTTANGSSSRTEKLRVTGDGNILLTNGGAILMSGQRIYQLADPASPSDSATKQYVDNAVSAGSIPYYFTLGASGIGSYYLTTNAQAVAESTNTTSAVTNGMLLAAWITPAGSPGLSTLAGGLYTVRHHGMRTAGTKTVQLESKLYLYATNGVETLVGTSDYSDIFTESDQPIVCSIAVTSTNISTTDRLLLKSSFITSSGNATTIETHYQDNTTSGLYAPASGSIYLPLSGGVLTGPFTVGGVLYPTADGSSNYVLTTYANGTSGWTEKTSTNGLASVAYVNGATNQAVITATNLAIGDIVARNYVTASVTNGLWPTTVGQSYVNGATNTLLSDILGSSKTYTGTNTFGHIILTSGTIATTPANGDDIVRKDYVDNALSALGLHFYAYGGSTTNIAAIAPGTQFLAYTTPSTNATVSTTVTGVTNGQYVGAAISTNTVNYITAGVCDFDVWLQKGAAGTLSLKAEFYAWDGVTETELGASPGYSISATKANYKMTVSIPQYTSVTPVRVIGKLKATSVTGGPPAVTIFTDGDEDSHYQLPEGSGAVPSTADKVGTNFVINTTAPLTGGQPLVGASMTLGIPAASAVSNGYLTSANWSTFNGKAETSVTNGLWAITVGQSYVNGATNQVLITSTNLAIGDIVGRGYALTNTANSFVVGQRIGDLYYGQNFVSNVVTGATLEVK